MPRTRITAKRKTPQIKNENIVAPGKGLNNFVSENLIDDAESSDLQNVEFIESGAVTKRGGYEQAGDDLSNNPRGLLTFNTSSTNYILTVDGTGLKYLNGSTWTSIAGATYDSSAEIDGTQTRGDLYIFDGVSGGTKLTSALSLSRPGTIPKGKFSVFYSGYHILSGVDGQETRVYVSKDTDASDFTDSGDDATSHPGATVFSGSNETQFFDVQKDDGEAVTGFAKFNEVLIIFKENSIYQMEFDSSGIPTVSAITKSVGAVNHKSIENVENDVFFLSRKGFYVLGNEPNFFDAIRTNELSARVKTTLDTIAQSSYNKVASIYFDNKYWSSIPIGGSTNQTTLTYDRRFLAWSKHTIKANSFTTLINSDNEEEMYFAADDTTKVYKYTPGTYLDDGAAIEAHYTTKAFDLDSFDTQKRWPFVDILLRQVSGSVDLAVYEDNDSLVASTIIRTSNRGGIGFSQPGVLLIGEDEVESTGTSGITTNVPYRIMVNKNSRTIKIKISNDSASERFVYVGAALWYYPLSPFKFDSTFKITP